MLQVYRIRLYPTPSQKNILSIQFGCARWVWNEALGFAQKVYLETGRSVGYYEMQNRLPALKREFEWLVNAYSQSLQYSLRNLAFAFQQFFENRSGYPRFKKKHQGQTLHYPQRVKINANRTYLPKVGWIKCVIHRNIVGKIKTVTVSQNASGQFYASILTDNGMPIPPVCNEGKAVGIDVGLLDLVATSDGSKFANPRNIKAAERNLKRKQKKLCRKQKGSISRNKARIVVARAHQRVADARRDYLHKLSRRIVDENQIVIVEDLNVKGMLKNHNLAKAISDAGWGSLALFIEHKCEQNGKVFIRVNRWFPSTKTCSACSHVCDKMGLDVRRWKCSHCGASHDRDVNAAKNIRDEGLRMLAAGIAVTASRGDVRRARGRKPSVHAVAVEAGNSPPVGVG